MPTLETGSVHKTRPADKAGTPKADETDAALAFALADCRWRLLSADRQKWREPDGLRTLTIAFLKYHSAKLALEAHPESRDISPSPSNAHLAA